MSCMNSTDSEHITSFGNSFEPSELDYYSHSTPYTHDERHTPSSLGWTQDTDLMKLYKFVAGGRKEEPHFELLPKWTITFQTPEKVYLDRPQSARKGDYRCQFPASCERSFGRPADLDRHYENVHVPLEERKRFEYDYQKCGRKSEPFGRKDHYRDHLRDYHKEDLGLAKQVGMRDWQTAQWKWMARTQRNLHDCWRCNDCLVRCYTHNTGWECHSCKQRCEPARIEFREWTPDMAEQNRYRDDTTSEVESLESSNNKQHASNKCWTRNFERFLKPGIDMGSGHWGKRGGVDYRWMNARPIILATTNLISGLLMGICFHWLRKSMNLGSPSAVMEWMAKSCIAVLPISISSFHLSNVFLFTSFALATCLVTGTTFLWALNPMQKTTAKTMASAVILMGMAFWSFMGVTPEELCLAFLPQCICLGVICSCVFDCGQKAGGHFGYEKVGFV